MRRSSCLYSIFGAILASYALHPVPLRAQSDAGTIIGTITDTSQAALPGAKVQLDPGNASASSDTLGQFRFSSVPPGTYKVTVDYVGLSPFTASVTVTTGQTATVNAVLKVASQNDTIIVTAERAHGESEAINLERSTENILEVLPARVITSLPNANIADAVARLPGVTLERDEGEGKYVQIRGTEPRLSNLTIDGVEVPSPEGGVRQVKLDTIPAGLVESVQIFKTLQADQAGNAIGGSVNIETKKAGEQPTISLFGKGGFTPIVNTVPVNEFGGTVGRRFGRDKRLGVILAGGFDYNGRGIDDIEPVPDPNSFPTPSFTQVAIREYRYDRSRYGFGGNVDYKLGNSSIVYARTLFSDFQDFGHRWEYTINTNDPTALPGTNVPNITTERRTGDYQVASLILGGNHGGGKWTLQWTAAAARARMLTPIGGGESHTVFNFIPATSNCAYNPAATTNPFLPQFTAACFTEAYNPANFQLAEIQQSAHGLTAQLNLEGSVYAARNYTLGNHFGIFQIGGRFINAHKFDNSYEIDVFPTAAAPVLLESMFLNSFKNSNYYGGHYQFGPAADWEKVNAFLAANPTLFFADPTMQAFPKSGNSNNFDLVERISSGYVMNTLSIGRVTIIGGLRFEGTQDDTRSFDNSTGLVSFPGHGSYTDVLPSVSLSTRLDSNSDIRFAYSRGISRPDPAFLTTATSLDNSTTPPTLTIGNPALVPEHAHNIDVLYERYLHPLGIIRGGFFYKHLSDPIVTLLSGPKPVTNPPGTFFVVQAANAGSAYIAGLELSFQQHFTYLPGLLKGLGVLANYSYATSRADHVNPGRSDSPALLRQAPHTWNISPTYDRGRLSVFVGMSYNAANIFSYAFVDGNLGGPKGPGGDQYLYAHYQVDAQGSFRLGKGFTALASVLNWNNEVFGFYIGSPQFPFQREYYKPTYSFGLRWDLGREQ